jgi:hypothetical protein
MRKILTAALLLALTGQAFATPMAGLAGSEVVFFDHASPGTILVRRTLSGLAAGETLLGIDMRPATGELFALTSTARLVTINPLTGGATLVGTPGAVTFTGTAFGVDFNPTVDRLRVVSDTDENMRFNPLTGGVAGTDTALTPAGDKVGVAYDRNVSATGGLTTMFVIDAGTDTLARQGGVDGTPSPNGGVITDIGPLGANTSTNVGFDIALDGSARASLNTAAGTTGLYNVNLATGAATLIGSFPANAQVTDVTHVGAIPFDLARAPAISTYGMIGLVAGLALLAVFGLRRR